MEISANRAAENSPEWLVVVSMMISGVLPSADEDTERGIYHTRTRTEKNSNPPTSEL